MWRKFVIVVAVACLTTALGVSVVNWVMDESPEERKVVTPGALLSNAVPAPPKVSPDEWGIILTEERDSWPRYDTEGALRAWSLSRHIGSAAGILDQRVFRYKNPRSARRAYEREVRQLPAFLGPVFSREEPKVHQLYDSDVADSAQVLCFGAGNSAKACGSWYFFGQYGQYVMSSYYGSGKIGKGEFLELVAQMEEHIGSVLR